MNDDLKILYEHALAFRNAIIMAISDGEINDLCLRNFPRGCCTFASDLLQHYLIDKNIKTYYVSGKIGDGWDGDSHSWLETEDGIVIDITGDQYSDNKNLTFDNPVYIGPREDGFHNLFKITDSTEYIVNNDPFIEKTKNELIYEIVIRYIQ